MAVLQRVRVISNERLDLPDFLNLDAFGNADWSAFVEKFFSDSPVIISGFDIDTPVTLIGTSTSSVSVNIDGGMLFHPTSTGGAGGFFVGASGSAQQSVSLTAGQTNFVEMDQTTSTGAADVRAIWDESGGSDGSGEEFTQTVDTVTDLEVDVTVNTTGFTGGSVPIAKVVVDSSGFITSITDSRNLIFRLGSGGTSPDPLNKFSWPNVPSGFDRVDTPVTVSSVTGVNPFQGSDKNIPNMKDWMDAVMSRISELQGSSYWFSNGGAISGGSLSDLWWDSVGSIFTTSGVFSWDSTTSTLAWSDTLTIQSVSGPYNFEVASSSKVLADGEVAYVNLVRNETIPSGSELTWTNGAGSVDGSAGAFTGLVVGDWIKKASDTWSDYVEITDFKDATGGGGSSTTAASALSVTVSPNYTGTSGTEVGSHASGDYASGDVQVDALADVPSDSDVWWLAYRTGSEVYIRKHISENKLTTTQQQDVNLNLVTKTPATLSGNFEWDGTDLLWEELYLSVPGTQGTTGSPDDHEERNKITDQTSTSAGLTDLADGECLYVSVNRSGTGDDTLTVTKTTVEDLNNDIFDRDDRIVFARRVDNDIHTLD